MLKVEDVFADLPILETKRLLLRKMMLEDQEDVFEYASDPLVTAHTIWDFHRSIDDSIRFIEFMLEKYAKKEPSNWAIVNKDNNKMIGTCGFVYWAPEHSRAEIGYALARPYWSQGLITEAAEKVVEFAFSAMKLNRLEARCNVDNTGSERVMQKLGMQFEGIIREQLFMKGEFKNIKLYSLLKNERG